MTNTDRRLINKAEEVQFDKDGNIIKTREKRKFASDEQIAKELIKNKGFISKVAENLSVPTTYVKIRIKANKALAEICNSMDDRILDLAEAKLLELISDKDFEAIKFVLKTKGKERGYIS